MLKITDISDYVIFRCKAEGETDLSLLKHQKLLYYIQAWNLAFSGKPISDVEFQAWIHGPVNRDIYDLYKSSKYLYSEMSMDDMVDKEAPNRIPQEYKKHIDSVLEVYGKYSAVQLEIMTHEEDPWLEARKGYSATQRCEVVIKNEIMQAYYAARLN